MMKPTTMVCFIAMLFLIIATPMVTMVMADDVGPFADVISTKINKIEEQKNIRTIEFSFEKLAVELGAIDIKFNADVITLPVAPEVATCKSLTGDVTVEATVNSFQFTFPNVAAGDNIEFICDNVTFDFNQVVDRQVTLTASAPGHENLATLSDAIYPINDDVEPVGDIASEVQITLTTRYDPSAETPTPLKNTRDFTLSITNSFIIDHKVVLTSSSADVLTLVSPAPAPVGMLCQIVDDDRSIPVEIFEEFATIIFDFKATPVAEGKNFVIDCKNVFYLDFKNVLGAEVSYKFGFSGDVASAASFISHPVDDDSPGPDPEPPKRPLFESLDVLISPYPDQDHSIPNTRSFIIAGEKASVEIPVESKIKISSQKEVFKKATPGEATICSINDVVASNIVYDDIGKEFTLTTAAVIAKDADIRITCVDNELFLDFRELRGIEFPVYIQLGDDDATMVAAALGPIDDDGPGDDFWFKSLTVTLGLYPDETNPIQNTRAFRIVANEATGQLPSNGWNIYLPHPIFTQAQGLEIHCTVNEIDIPTTISPEKDQLLLDTTVITIEVGGSAEIVCLNTIYIDFSTVTGKAFDLVLRNQEKLEVAVISTIGPVDDQSPPTPGWFKGLSAQLSNYPDPQSGKTNKRKFVLFADAGAEPIEMTSWTFSTNEAILKVNTAVQVPSCLVGTIQVPTELKADGKSIVFDVSEVPQFDPNVQVKIDCKDNFYLDFSNNRDKKIPVYLFKTSTPEMKVNFILPAVNDDATVQWPMQLNIPIRTENQSFMTLNIDNLPPQSTTGSNELVLNAIFSGATIQTRQSRSTNSTLHYLSMTSYASDKADEKPVTSGFPINIDSNGRISAATLAFPKNAVKLSVSIQVATVKTADVVKVNVEVTGVGNQVHYYPDTTKTAIEWPYNISPFYIDAKNTVKMSFGSFGGDKKKNTFGPSFQIAFPPTQMTLMDTTLTLRTNSSIPITETVAAFNYNGDAKKVTCNIPEFKVDVPVTKDANGQELTFDFAGVKKLEKSGEKFTLKCPNFNIIPSQKADGKKKLPEEAVAFTISGANADKRVISTSWIATLPKEKSGGHGVLTFFIILFILIAVLGGAYYAYKKKVFRQCSGDKEASPLLGETSIQ